MELQTFNPASFMTGLWKSHRKRVLFMAAGAVAVLALMLPAIAYMDEPTGIQGQEFFKERQSPQIRIVRLG